MAEEKRDRTRIPIKFDVIISIGKDEIPVKTWDLSMRGLQCSSDPKFKQDENCQVSFILSPLMKFQLEGKITRTSKDSTGIYFSGIPAESFHHLKSLLQYNTDDPEKIEKEISSI